MILKDLKKHICEILEIDEYELTRNESDIIQVCSEIIDSKLEEIRDLNDENKKLKIKIRNLEIFKDDVIEDNKKKDDNLF